MKRVQIVCIGSSSLYGVGGTKGSWADIFKRELHTEQYGPGGPGEVHEMYNLAIPGASIEDFLQRVAIDLPATRKPGRKLITVVQLGGNNTLAIDEPNNFVTSPEEFKKLVREMLNRTKKFSDEVLWIGMNLMDETKTMPRVKDPEKNTKVYFPNQRKVEFDIIAKEVCSELGVKHISLIEDQQKLDWADKYQYEDGVHPNDKGYQWMYDMIAPSLHEAIEKV